MAQINLSLLCQKRATVQECYKHVTCTCSKHVTVLHVRVTQPVIFLQPPRGGVKTPQLRDDAPPAQSYFFYFIKVF